MAIEKNQLTAGKILLSIIFIIMLEALFMFLSGDWFWIEGWIFSLWLVTIYLSTFIYYYQKDPELLAERLRQPGRGNQKAWDVYFIYLILILFYI
ncbi:hypothetical protein RIVM261_022210 [Rivularia sp. IAM M-261]|nr:hypothetical protein RIVM261_022210 [Rivularia sp. IAM M-261]